MPHTTILLLAPDEDFVIVSGVGVGIPDTLASPKTAPEAPVAPPRAVFEAPSTFPLVPAGIAPAVPVDPVAPVVLVVFVVMVMESPTNPDPFPALSNARTAKKYSLSHCGGVVVDDPSMFDPIFIESTRVPLSALNDVFSDR